MLIKLFLFALGLVWMYMMIRLMYKVFRSMDIETKDLEHQEVNDRFKKVVDFSKNSDRVKQKKDRIDDFLKND